MKRRRSAFARVGPSPFRSAWPVLLACLLGPGAGAEDGLGRLFSTPQQRAQLDALRRRGEAPAPRGAESDEGPAQTTLRLTVNGVVERERGPGVVWINGERVSRGERTRQGIRGQGEEGGRVRLILPRDAGIVRLKAGQRIDLMTGAERKAGGEGLAPASAAAAAAGAAREEAGP